MANKFLRKRILNLEFTGDLYADLEFAYSLRKYNGWTNAVLKLRRSSDAAVKFVFFDGDTITLNSFVGDTNTTPSATTLGTWIGASTANVSEWIAQTPDNIINNNYIALQTNVSFMPELISSGSLITINSKVAIKFDGNDVLDTPNPITALDADQTHTIVTVAQNDVSNNTGTIFNTAKATSNRYIVFSRRSGGNLVITRAEAGTVVDIATDIQYDVANQKLQSNIIDNKKLTAYQDSVEFIASPDTFTGSYTNDVFRIGSQFNFLTYLNGTIQEIIGYPSNKTSIISNIHNEINLYYNIY